MVSALQPYLLVRGRNRRRVHLRR